MPSGEDLKAAISELERENARLRLENAQQRTQSRPSSATSMFGHE